VRIRKAVITAAGPDQRELPLQVLVDRTGKKCSALRILLDEAASAGVTEIAVVVHPDDRVRYAAAAEGTSGQKAAPKLAPKLVFVPQSEARGYAHAIAAARDFVGGEPFLHFVGDHLFVSDGPARTKPERGAAQELVALAEAEGCAISAVQSTREGQLGLYGAIGGTRLRGAENRWTIDAVLEKPTPTEAEQRLFVPGMRAGHYLCFFGMHVLPASIFGHIDAELRAAPAKTHPPLTSALARLIGTERWLACELPARRINLGEKYGLLAAQLSLSLTGPDRDEVLTLITDLLAQRERGR
jgi:UTP--glucose-1-phosphate uridylyltransferase